MRFVLAIFLFVHGWLFAVETDFDVAVVGTSPVSMLEAIYHAARHERVLILEADNSCGGAWKSVDICGVRHADLGCHLIGSDNRLKEFFEKYFGCSFVCLDHPYEVWDNSHLRCGNGFYFSRGCHELITHLETTIASQQNALLFYKKLQSVFIDSTRGLIELNLGDVHYTTRKLILTPASSFHVDNPVFQNVEIGKHLYNHLYMLVEDAAPSRFTYLNGITLGMSRAMNLTPFLRMPSSNLQMIVVQTYGNSNSLAVAEEFLEAFKQKGYLSINARIITTDTYIYNQAMMNVSTIQRLGGPMVEVLESSGFAGMAKYVDKWKSAMVPLK